jgi:hypothetical protein
MEESPEHTEESKNKMRTEVRKYSNVSEHITISLQTNSPDMCEEYLSERITFFERKENLGVETSSHISNLKGLCAILQVLMANIDLPGRTIRYSFLNFNEAFSLFMSYHPNVTEAVLTDRNCKKIFQDFVLHPKHGIPVYVVKKQYLLLRTNEVDLDLFIQDIINNNKDKEKHFNQMQSKIF